MSKKPEEIVIVIFPTANDGGGYNYDIYAGEEDEITGALEFDTDPADGGQCTTTLKNALEMAYEQAKQLLK